MNFKKFCSELEWSLPIAWFERRGVVAMGDDLRAIVTLETHGTHDNFPGFEVRILNLTHGEIDRHYFRFDAYLDSHLAARTDGRDDYPTRGNACFKVIGHCGSEFYIAKPKTTRPFCAAIEAYIDQFRRHPSPDVSELRAGSVVF